jgi:hypothetical protein
MHLFMFRQLKVSFYSSVTLVFGLRGAYLLLLMVTSPQIRCTPQVHPSLETQLTPTVQIGSAEVALFPPNKSFESQGYRYFYQVIRGLITECSGFTNNVYASNHKTYCLTETWLNDTNFTITISRPLVLYFVLRESI